MGNQSLGDHSKLSDVVFKVLSAGLLPAAMWINTLSVDIALLKQQAASNTARIERLESDLRATERGVGRNQLSLESLSSMISYVRELLTEIRDAAR